MLKELFKYFAYFIIPAASSRDITIVRRYKTATGWVGELYIDGKHVGMTCDNFIDGQELIRHALQVGYEGWKRVLRTDIYVISRGDFQALVPYNTCYVGSLDPKTNDGVLSELINKCNGYKYLRMTVLNRPLIEA